MNRATHLLAGMLATVIASSAHAGLISIDFDFDAQGNAIDAGQIIDDEYAAWGVNIVTENYNKSFDYGIAFDSEHPTGGDSDLGTGKASQHPSTLVPMGNILIISERGWINNDGNIGTPDDEGGRPAGYFDFFYNDIQNGGSVGMIDIQHGETSSIELYLDDDLQASLPMLSMDDNELQVVDLGDNAFNKMRIKMGGSGGVTSVITSSPPSDVPEPASLALLGVGLGMVLSRPQKRRT